MKRSSECNKMKASSECNNCGGLFTPSQWCSSGCAGGCYVLCVIQHLPCVCPTVPPKSCRAHLHHRGLSRAVQPASVAPSASAGPSPSAASASTGSSSRGSRVARLPGPAPSSSVSSRESVCGISAAQWRWCCVWAPPSPQWWWHRCVQNLAQTTLALQPNVAPSPPPTPAQWCKPGSLAAAHSLAPLRTTRALASRARAACAGVAPAAAASSSNRGPATAPPSAVLWKPGRRRASRRRRPITWTGSRIAPAWYSLNASRSAVRT